VGDTDDSGRAAGSSPSSSPTGGRGGTNATDSVFRSKSGNRLLLWLPTSALPFSDLQFGGGMHAGDGPLGRMGLVEIECGHVRTLF